MPKLSLYCKVTILILLTITLSGCWDRRELQDLQIPNIVGYDTALESEKEYPDDKVLVSMGWPVTSEEAEEKYHTEGMAGYLIGETRSRRNTHIGEQLVVGQLQSLIFGEEFARRFDITGYSDALSRNTMIKGTIHFAVVKGRATDIIGKKVRQYPNSGEYVKILLKNIRKTNFYPEVIMFQYYRDVYTNFTIPLLPLIIEKNGDIVAAGSCLISDGKIAGELGREETQTAVMLRGEECYGILSYDVFDKGRKIDQVSFQGSNDRKLKIEKIDGKYHINITIMLNGAIIEHDKETPFKAEKDLLGLSEKSLEDNIKKRAEAFVRKVQNEYKFEALNVGSMIRAHTREKLTQKDVNQIIQNADIKVDVKVKIINTGGKI